jgi:CheY-like chemotaxis protein
VRGDPTRPRQILLNLLGNAVKFTERGEVVMSVECEVRDEHGWELHFVVRDTGIGIPPDKQKVIFEAFSQADSSTTRKFGGTGLGLAISSRLVHMMAGRIWVNSRLGEGSEFHFTVRLDVAAEMAEPVPANTAHLAGVRVLVVDDSHTSRRILAEILDRWGMRTVLAASGEAGLAALEAANAAGEKFGLVLLDVNMPGMDGFLSLEAARKTGSLATAAVLMLTSGHQPGDAARCRELGAVSYLTKPIRQQDLLKALQEAVGRTSVPTPTEGATGEAKAHNRVNRPLHILLAEDNPVNQRVALGLLQKRGHSVIVAGNGREALDALRAAAMRENEKNTGQHVPIIAMTAHAMKGDAEICLQAGMDDYVSKPVQPARLFQVVEKIAADLSPAAA